MRFAPLLFAPALLLAVVGEEWSGVSAPEKSDPPPERSGTGAAAEREAPPSPLPLQARR